MKSFMFMLVCLCFIFNAGYGMKCYICDSTSLIEGEDNCATGKLMRKEECPGRQGYVCSEFKYKLYNTTVYATSRGCEKIRKGSICEEERLEAKKFLMGMVKLDSCYVCDKPLCNSVIRKRY